jgi:hypothetical protein
MHAVEVSFESIDVSGPQAAERSEPGIQLPKRFWCKAVETALGIHGRLHETGVAQDPEVLGNGGLRHSELAFDLSDGLLRRDEEAQDGAAIGFGDDFEDGFHTLDILQCAYTCQGIYEKYKNRVLAPAKSRCAKSNIVAVQSTILTPSASSPLK